MPRSQRPRHQKRYKVSSDFTRHGMEVVKPEHATEQAARKYLSTFTLLARTCLNREVREAVLPILRNNQSVTKKAERIRAVVLNRTVQEFHSPAYHERLGNEDGPV